RVEPGRPEAGAVAVRPAPMGWAFSLAIVALPLLAHLRALPAVDQREDRPKQRREPLVVARHRDVRGPARQGRPRCLLPLDWSAALASRPRKCRLMPRAMKPERAHYWPEPRPILA